MKPLDERLQLRRRQVIGEDVEFEHAGTAEQCFELSRIVDRGFYFVVSVVRRREVVNRRDAGGEVGGGFLGVVDRLLPARGVGVIERGFQLGDGQIGRFDRIAERVVR